LDAADLAAAAALEAEVASAEAVALAAASAVEDLAAVAPEGDGRLVFSL
jgi:hypothetical protein